MKAHRLLFSKMSILGHDPLPFFARLLLALRMSDTYTCLERFLTKNGG